MLQVMLLLLLLLLLVRVKPTALVGRQGDGAALVNVAIFGAVCEYTRRSKATVRGDGRRLKPAGVRMAVLPIPPVVVVVIVDLVVVLLLVVLLLVLMLLRRDVEEVTATATQRTVKPLPVTSGAVIRRLVGIGVALRVNDHPLLGRVG